MIIKTYTIIPTTTEQIILIENITGRINDCICIQISSEQKNPNPNIIPIIWENASFIINENITLIPISQIERYWTNPVQEHYCYKLTSNEGFTETDTTFNITIKIKINIQQEIQVHLTTYRNMTENNKFNNLVQSN